MIAAVVGIEAEQLVYLFCIADRQRFYEVGNGQPTYIVVPSMGNQTCAITPRQFAHLLEIEVANIVDQARLQESAPVQAVRDWFSAFDSKRQYLSAAASETYASVLADWLSRHRRR
jgi:hypothetical protein